MLQCSQILAAAAWGLWAAKLTKDVAVMANNTRRQAHALRQLPGPRYGVLGVLPIAQSRRDLHRLLTEWAEAYGPVYRIRFLMIHVRSLFTSRVQCASCCQVAG